MVAFWQLFLLMTQMASGTLLELTSPAGKNPVISSQFGVDISRCTSITLQIKSCHSAHLWLGDGSGDGSYEIAVGIENNAKTNVRPCRYCLGNPIISVSTVEILGCTSFRTYWLSWENNQLSFGKGNLPKNNIVFEAPNPKIHEIRVFGFMGYTGTSMMVILGDDSRSRFEVVSDNAKFSDTPIAEIMSSLYNCTLSCHHRNNCGMFSYSAQGECALFDRMTSSFDWISKAGWKSWKMRYCWP